MTKLSDYYAVVLTNKWFYLSIAATVVSALLLDKWLSSFVQDYLQFGPIADLQVPALHFLYLTFRYSIPLTEIGILSWEWYAPIEAEAKEPELVSVEAAMPVAVTIPEAPVAIETVVKSEPINPNPLAFDPKTGILSFRGKTCEIPFRSKQLAVCQALFEHPGERVTEYDILMLIDEALAVDPTKAGRSIRDAVYALNAKAKAAFGIEELFMWSKLTVWINEEYAPDFLGG